MRKKTINILFLCLIAANLMQPSVLAADEVNITPHMSSIEIDYQGKKISIERIQDQENKLTNSFSKTSRKCPPFCIQPTSVAPGVETVSEIDLLYFLTTRVKDKTGLLIDARVKSFYTRGTIPGSVNIPFNVFSKDTADPAFAAAMKQVGAKEKSMGKWDFTDAKPLILWCNGPWCGQSPHAIKALLSLGYPASLLQYYRGGMQMWQILGLTTVPGK
ncbi:MAG: rhodanese-like domain-containing protein [Arenicellales bacterium]